MRIIGGRDFGDLGATAKHIASRPVMAVAKMGSPFRADVLRGAVRSIVDSHILMSKFKAGQLVRVLPSHLPNAPAPGLYEVIRPLHNDSGHPQYRVKGAHEEFQRVVDEALLTDPSDLTPAAGPDRARPERRRERLPV